MQEEIAWITASTASTVRKNNSRYMIYDGRWACMNMVGWMVNGNDERD
jgi:hypothetical protein